jgi:hypothetical protein
MKFRSGELVEPLELAAVFDGTIGTERSDSTLRRTQGKLLERAQYGASEAREGLEPSLRHAPQASCLLLP